MNKVLIRGLQVACRIGCEPKERNAPQRLELDLSISLADNKAATSGQLADTVCYKQSSQKILALAVAGDWPLLEQFAEDTVALIFEDFPAARSVLLEVRKFVIAEAKSVGLEIFRERRTA